jgi:hypothetical protein
MSIAKSYRLGLILATATFAIAGSTQAAHRPHPGLVCVEQGDSTPEITYEFLGAVRNGGTQQWLLCPLVRFNAAADMDVTDWDVSVDRRGATTAWDMTLWSTNTDGASGFASTVSVPASPASGAQAVDGGTIASAFVNGLLFVETLAPAGVEIRRITASET